MMSKNGTDSEEVFDAQFIGNDENEPITVRYNALAYERKLQQVAKEQAGPITQRAVCPAPITQRAVPKAKKPSQAAPPKR
jgi:hypothetical protein